MTRLAYSFLASLLLATATWSAFAQAEPGGPAASAAASAVLYDQTTGTPGGLLPISTPGSAHQAADDFTVPPGPTWVVDGIDLVGAGAGATTVSIAPDAGGLPGSGGGGAVERDQQSPGSNPKQFFDTPLAPGKYWVYVGGTNEDWSWRAQAPQAGLEALWAGYGPACPMPPVSLRPVSECGEPGPDMQFKVNGELISSNFELGRPSRSPNGGVSIRATFRHPGQVTFGGPGLKRKVNGPHSAKAGDFAQTMNFVPKPAVKKALTAGAKRRTTAVVTYTPFFGTANAGAPSTKKFKLLLKRNAK